MDGVTPGSSWGDAPPIIGPDSAIENTLPAPAPAPRTREVRDHILSPSVVKKFALAVSKKKRAGKFTRVSEEFVVACQAEFEGRLRGLVNTLDVEAVTKLVPVDGMKFTTKVARDKAAAKLEELAIAIVHGKVMRHPSLGKTLMD